MKSKIIKNLLNKKIFIDSRQVSENSVFVCIKGPKNDGHKFIKLILDRYKKTVIICDKKSKLAKNYKDKSRVLFCNSTIKFLSDLAKIKRLILNKYIFIGITGSSGKTTLKEILYSVLKKYKPSYKSQKSFNNVIGLPYTLINQTNKTKYNIYEIGMNKIGEIDYLANILKPNIGIITNIGEAHIGNLGSVKNIARAKSEIINNITKGGYIILNRDCKFFSKLEKISKKNKLKILTFGSNFKSTITYEIIKENILKIKLRKKIIKLKLREKNLNNINNILISILVLNILRLNIKISKKLLSNIKSIRGRGNRIKLNNKKIEIIDDSYNSNPVSLKNSIYQFNKIKTNKKKYLVIGDMLELGKFSEKKHLEVGEYLKLMKFDRIFLVGKHTSKIFFQIKSTFWCKYFNNINNFSKYFKNLLMENSIIMFKASNGVGLNKLLDKKIYKC